MKKIIVFLLLSCFVAVAADISESNRSWKHGVIEKSYTTALYGGFTLPSGMFVRTDAETRFLIAEGAYRASVEPTFVFYNWQLADGSYVDLNAQTLIALDSAVKAHIQGCVTKRKQLLQAIDAATTVEELKAIGW